MNALESNSIARRLNWLRLAKWASHLNASTRWARWSSCGLGDQADKLADEYVRLAEQTASAVVVSQTWAEVHRVNSRVRDALKAKGLLGANDTTVQVLDRLDLTNAQKRDERFYPKDAVVVFNQKIREAEPGAKGKLAGIVKLGVLVEVDGRFVTVSNKMLDRISVCQTRELAVATGDRLHLKANRKLASGGRVTNGELVAVKSVRADGGIELTDGRVLDSSFREFLPGYAVTSYGSQGKTVDYVLFSDSTVKAATNAQQWYVTISRGPARHPHFHPRQAATPRECHPIRSSSIGDGIGSRHCPAPCGPPLGPAAWLFASLWSSSCRQLCSAKNGSPPSPSL